ncbi:MAG TPA: hypothetical protein VN033_02025 [Vulgatibacter sp.]|nr:hypothetical protein [Vulgatibacter sp.]
MRSCFVALLALLVTACETSKPPIPIPNDGAPIQGAFFRPVDAPDAPAGNLFSVWGDRDGVVWAVGEKGLVARLHEGRWEVAEPLTDEDLRSVWGRAADDVWVVGTRGTILHYSKRTPLPEEDPDEILPEWRLEPSPTDLDLNAVAGGGGRLYAVGQSGTILSHDEEAGWTLLEDGPTLETINGLFVDGGGRAVAVGNLGLLLRSTEDGGWSRQRIDGVNQPLRAVWGIDADRFYAVGLDGIILRANGDEELEPIPGSPKVFLRGIFGTSMGNAWIVGWGGTVLHLNGSRATPIDPAATDRRLEAVWGRWVVDPETEESRPLFHLVGVNGTVLYGP